MQALKRLVMPIHITIYYHVINYDKFNMNRRRRSGFSSSTNHGVRLFESIQELGTGSGFVAHPKCFHQLKTSVIISEVKCQYLSD